MGVREHEIMYRDLLKYRQFVEYINFALGRGAAQQLPIFAVGWTVQPLLMLEST